jgi:lysophospholipase L1-like esterase
MLPPGGTADVHVQLTSTNGKPTPSGAVTLLAIPPEGDTRSSTFTLDKQGRATCTFAPADGPVGIWKLVLAHPDSGWARSIDADVLPKQQYALFEKAAAALPDLPHPPHYLFLGDSLTDMFRGQNYVDKIEFWLQKRYGDSASVRNAGVGGDFITRVWDRLTGEPKAYRLNMYDDLYTPKPDRIFIFLGHNDSKATSSSGYTKHCVDPDTFATLYAKTLEKLKADTDAPVTVLTSTSSVYEITAENARKRTEAGKAHNLFGKPEHLELFNSIAARVAKDAGCDLLDVYAPTRDAPDKKALFVADGVHVSNKGNRLLARLILDYLGSLPQRP